MSEVLLQLDGVGHAYDDRRALHEFSLTLHRGQRVAILGPNGAGKSTLFKVLSGLLEPQLGKMKYNGQVVAVGEPSFRARCGVVFQSASLDDLLSPMENLIVSGGFYGKSGPGLLERATKLLQMMGLDDRKNDKVGQLSGGLRRRVELARSLVHEPELLLLDEPTTGLDELQYRRFWDDLDRLRQEEGISVLLVTHRPDEAERCDQLIFLNEGEIVASGSPDELKARATDSVVSVLTSAVETVCQFVEELGISPEVRGNRMTFSTPSGHGLIPRLVESVPTGSVQSIEVRAPDLGDVFVAVTGRALEVE